MNATANSFVFGDQEAILDRHCVRRISGVPTVSVLVGPVVAGGRTWRRWAIARGRNVVVASRNQFPRAEWIRSATEKIDIPDAAVSCLARRAERDPDEFLCAWRARTPGDCERFWNTLAPDVDDDLLRAISFLALSGGSPDFVSKSLSALGERIVPMIVRLAPSTPWPSVLFVAGSPDDVSTIGNTAARGATQTPAVPIAVAVPTRTWAEFLATARDSRAKALLREGEILIPAIDAATIEHTLHEAGIAENSIGVIAATEADAALVESAIAAVRASAVPPTTQEEDDRARSAVERFLFEFLTSLPGTAGLFELNAALDFRFGPRPAEVDLLCRSPRIAIEIDGYFHFLDAEDYRRDRNKDWELQRRGFVVLRFLAEDVIPQLEMIRDRILNALASTPPGEPP